MRDNFNDNWEEVMRKDGVPKSTDYIKAKLSMELELLKANGSVVNDSIGQIENNVVSEPSQNLDNPFASDSGNSMEKNNVRVRKIDVLGGMPVYKEPTIDTSDRNYYGGYNEDNVTGYSSNNMGGIASTLILISTAVLVTLVVLVSLYIMKTMGL